MEGNYKKWLNRINAKQDVLTEDNVGEFMDVKLSTKSAPTSGDTVLGRDSVTGKAVEIPTSSLGGSGNVDTSNLVPYTGANKDVNIGAFYFEAAGFKTPNGTSNQALTANGGTFDLNTKADLENGKIPATQLPSYVDDVLEYASWVNFPATGESSKIYIAIDTNLTYRWGGSSYVVMSSSLALGETSSTAYRGDRGKIAYDHSQTTGNIHNTKVEELSDVSGDATTIADTDEILKKETGGLWKKLSWSNIKATLKDYFDSLYAPKAFNVKVTTPSNWVTGTTSETEVLRIEIPANSLSASDVLRIPFLMINKLGTNGTIQIKGRMSTSTTMPSGLTDQLFQSAIAAATNQFIGLDRSFIIDNGNLKGFPAGMPSYTSSAISSNLILSKPFDRTVTNYLYISIVLFNSADQARLEGIQLTNS